MFSIIGTSEGDAVKSQSQTHLKRGAQCEAEGIYSTQQSIRIPC